MVMANGSFDDQSELDQELDVLQPILGESPCELIRGEVPGPDAHDSSLLMDLGLQHAIQRHLAKLEADQETPRFLLYQMPSGQQSMICLAIGNDEKLLVTYRDFNARPPTKRIENTIKKAIEEFYEGAVLH